LKRPIFLSLTEKALLTLYYKIETETSFDSHALCQLKNFFRGKMKKVYQKSKIREKKGFQGSEYDLTTSIQ